MLPTVLLDVSSKSLELWNPKNAVEHIKYMDDRQQLVHANSILLTI